MKSLMRGVAFGVLGMIGLWRFGSGAWVFADPPSSRPVAPLRPAVGAPTTQATKPLAQEVVKKPAQEAIKAPTKETPTATKQQADGRPTATKQQDDGRPSTNTPRKGIDSSEKPLSRAVSGVRTGVVKKAPSVSDAADKKNEVTGMIAQQFRDEFWNKGPLLALLLIFGAGFLISLTPCVYPMIPITIAVIGASSAKKEGERGHAFLLSLMYVLGMALPAAILGAVVALIGKQPFMMGALMQSTFFVVFLTLLFLLMALSMFGMFDLALPTGIQTRLSMIQGRGYLGVFVLGMIGIVLSTPCSGPAMIGLLAFVAQTGSVFWGVVLPTVMAFGIGVPFLLLGTGFVAALPRSGTWMTEVKKVFGVVFLGAAFLYGRGLFSSDPALYSLILGGVLICVGIFAGALRPYHEEDGWWVRSKQVFGVLNLLVGSVLFVQIWLSKGYFLPTPSAPSKMASTNAIATDTSSLIRPTQIAASLPVVRTAQTSNAPTDPALAACLPPPNYPEDKPFWLTSEPQGIACAKRLKRPIILDFWAEWCEACKRLEKISFAQAEVVKESRRFVMLKLEQTASHAESERLEKKYGISGLPWVRFVDSNGQLLSKPLIIGFVSPTDLLALMRKVH